MNSGKPLSMPELNRALCREPSPAPSQIEHASPPDAERWTLPGQRSLHVRLVEPADSVAMQAFVAGLSPTTRYKRFHVGLLQLSPTALRALVEVDHQQHVALVGLVPTGHGAHKVVADARYVRLASAPSEAEFAIVVDDAWQGLGLGRKLMDRLARHARRQGLRTLVGDVLHDNQRMRVLLQSLGARAEVHPDGPHLARLIYTL